MYRAWEPWQSMEPKVWNMTCVFIGGPGTGVPIVGNTYAGGSRRVCLYRYFPCLDVHGPVAVRTLRRLALALYVPAVHECAGLCATFGIGGGCVNLAVWLGWSRGSSCMLWVCAHEGAR